MLLSDIIARLTDERAAAETIAGLGDPALLARMQAQADANGIPLGTYAAWAVRSYADGATPAEWTTLMGALGRSADPGATCLRRAFAYVVRASGETAHEHAAAGHHG